ncbi:MAG: LacI family DNA-binding transcriptional regulator [Verrucomicrobiota bacterium]
MNRPVTQQRIAEEVGVSVATVSKALRNDPAIRPATRSAVLDTAETLGYEPARVHRKSGNRNGKNGQTKTSTVGVLIRNEESNSARGHVRMLAGISEMCDHVDAELLVQYFSGDRIDQLTAGDSSSLLPRRRLNGLILLNNWPENLVAHFCDRWPVVQVNHIAHDSGSDVIETDNTDGIYRMVKRLADLGHRRLAFARDRRGYSWSHARFGAFVQAVGTLGLEYDHTSTAILNRHDRKRAAEWAMSQMNRGITACVCVNDTIAHALGDGLLDRGIRIPDDISITGFDGEQHLRDGRQVTSIATPFEALGSAAVHRLAHRLAHPQTPRAHILMTGRPLDGETIAAPSERNCTRTKDQPDPTDQTDPSPPEPRTQQQKWRPAQLGTRNSELGTQ